MDDRSSSSSGGGKAAGSRSKTAGISTSTRLQRNQAEKERRDKLNGFISELATLVPMVSNASKPLDKVSILRLAAAEMRLHFSCLNPKRYKNKPLALPPAIMGSLDLIEKTIGGFIIVTTLTGLIVFCSRSIEDYLGYQNIDVMGNKVVKYIYEDDIKYFETKVTSVVHSLKKGTKKKSKVIKAHMLQKPLPRSNESCRPRNMIFKISVHQNDMGENNGNECNQSTSILKKTRAQKDFGYSAVVLMFIEPVRLEPEIDITYIDSNQDVYFTRHGLQGEIIYADQRISSITGYMPHDVQGQSAYQYICSSDVPIALFAQQAMFTSSDGKGDIVYRLRIRDMRFIYLQSSGQIAYKESSNEISHFVCFNRLLSEEEGSQELKKFQQRFAPQIMAAKMLQVKQTRVSNQSENTEAMVEQGMTLVNSSAIVDAVSPVASVNSFKVSSPEVLSGSADEMLSNVDVESYVSPSSSATGASSVHSSDAHSMTSPPTSINRSRSNSIASEFSGYTSDRMDFVVEKTVERSPLKTDYNSYVVGTCESLINDNKGANFVEENPEHCASGLSNNITVCHTEGVMSKNRPFAVQQQSEKSQTMHSVNAFSTLNGHPMELSFNNATLSRENVTFEFTSASNNSNGFTSKDMDLRPNSSGHHNAYSTHNGQPSKGNLDFISLQANHHLPVTQNHLGDQQLNFQAEQISRNRHPSQPSDSLNLSGMYQASPVSRLLKNSNNQQLSDLNDAASYSPDISSYHEIGNHSNNYLPTNICGYNSGANETAYNDLVVLNPKLLSGNPRQMNGFQAPVAPVDVLTNFTDLNSFDSMDTSLSVDAISEKNEFGSPDFPVTAGVGSPVAECQSTSSDVYSNLCGRNIAAVKWTGTHVDSINNVDLSLNKELYEELDCFFQNLPQSDVSQNSGVAEQTASEFPVVSNSIYPQNSISLSRAKRNYHQ